MCKQVSVCAECLCSFSGASELLTIAGEKALVLPGMWDVEVTYLQAGRTRSPHMGSPAGQGQHLDCALRVLSFLLPVHYWGSGQSSQAHVSWLGPHLSLRIQEAWSLHLPFAHTFASLQCQWVKSLTWHHYIVPTGLTAKAMEAGKAGCVLEVFETSASI